MATGMTRWIGLAAAGIVGVALVGLPPAAPNLTPWSERHPQAELARQLGSEVYALNRALKRVRVQDSLRTVLAESGEAGRGVVTGHLPEVEDLGRRRVVDGALSRDVDALGERHSDVVLGAFWVPRGQRGYDLPAELGGRFWVVGPSTVEWYGGELGDGRSYCMVAIPIDPDYRGTLYGLDLPTRGSRLGPCAYWARFGPPGPAVEEWLARTGGSVAVGRTLREEQLETLAAGGAGLLGRFFMSPWHGSLHEIARCTDGEVERCAALFLGAETGPRPAAGVEQAGDAPVGLQPVGYLGTLDRWGGGSGLGLPGTVLLADLEREFGAGALRDFWASEVEVPQAFRAAFGVELGPWTAGWLAGYYPDVRPGTKASGPSGILSALGVLLLGLALGGLAMRRREVA